MDESQNSLSAGMLIDTMIGLRMPDDLEHDSRARELLTAAFPEKLDLMRSLTDSTALHSAGHGVGHSAGHRADDRADDTADDTADEAGA